MEIIHIDPIFTAFIRPKDGANVGLVHTPKGMILIDTTSSPAEMQALLSAVGARPEEVQRVVNTHFPADHTWGNQLFTCPILAHRLCRERMRSELAGEWSQAALQSHLAELEGTDPKKSRELHQVLENLHIQLPDEVFDDRFETSLGGVQVELIHMGGHTPDTSIVWLPEQKVLYASDLIFQGRYPYIFDADIPAWIQALDHLLVFGAETIIPGHGVLCGAAEIMQLRQYLQGSWDLTAEHIRLGHSAEATSADAGFPVFPGEKYDRLHVANIRRMYQMQVELKS